ncbi:hypothetical protein [Arcobacter sp. LA11]|uniref:hypothetical protein n=1 Tax=Arcobacter sp. LA11 TaxID=1898176 RepID=UPI000932C55D|nr:hypothetical protein [Arcobacter sp. LA11]
MIIYIYGSDSFKKDIHDVLNHSNIKFRLDEHGEIIDLKTLGELKNAIEANPNNIYLIDDSKIIKKNALNQKIKFLKPKDGIEQEYLLDNGIGDISVDSIDELSKHIIKRLEAVIDDKESDEIQESIIEIVEDAYENNDEKEEKEYIQLDDELSSLLAHVEEKDIDVFEKDNSLEIDLIVDDKEEKSPLEDLSFEEDFDKIEIDKEKIDINLDELNKNIEESIQGDEMADEFSEFDTLNEDEILAALDGVGSDVSTTTSNKVSSITSNDNESINISGASNVDEIAQLISKLLNNKTLEITVKVKD